MGNPKRLLIRVYPRAWRNRYGEEFALLLEATPLTARVVANVLGAAAREWILRTLTGRLVMGPAIAYVALLTAQFLSAVVAAEPTFSLEGGQRLITPPWPVSLGFIQSIVGFAVLGRVVLRGWLRIRLGSAEFVCWTVALFAGSVAHQWALMEMNLGTGIAPWPLWTVWTSAAVSITSNLMFLFLASRGMPAPGQTRSPYTGSSRPLGLS